MKKAEILLTSICFLIVVYMTASPLTVLSQDNTEDVSPNYKLVWEENFSGTQLDETQWSKIDRQFPDWCNYMTHNEKLYSQKRGRMRLYAKENKNIAPNDTAPYLTGGISTRHKQTFTYGKIEVRARIKGAKGCWPAIWIKNENSKDWGYPQRAEIDILEYYNQDEAVSFTLHSNYTDILKKTKKPLNQVRVPIKKNKYNIYTLEILPDRVIYSVNRIRRLTYPKIETQDAGQFPYGTECYLLIDMQVGNKWLKDIGVEDFPAYMDIDWVRFYKL